MFVLSPFYILISMYWKMMHRRVRDLSCKPNVYAFRSTSELRVRLVPLKMFKPSCIFFTDHSNATLFCEPFCYLCLFFVMVFFLCLAAL